MNEKRMVPQPMTSSDASYWGLVAAGYPLSQILSCPRNDVAGHCPCNYAAARNQPLPVCPA